MVPWTAASEVWRVLSLPYFSFLPQLQWLLLQGRATTPVNVFPTFLASTMYLLGFWPRKLARKSGPAEKGNAQVRVSMWILLPGIFLSNTRLLCNKVEELILVLKKSRDFSTSCVLCFMKMWLCGLWLCVTAEWFPTLQSGQTHRAFRQNKRRWNLFLH